MWRGWKRARRRGARPTISVIMPVLDEVAGMLPALTALEAQGPDEIVVVDGGSRDGTRQVLARWAQACPQACVLDAPRGRGQQLAAGAARAAGEVLLFLHADTRLPPGGVELVRRAVAAGAEGGWFALALDEPSWLARAIGWLATRRSRLCRVATGDMALFATRRAYQAAGGFPPVPLMEDLLFSARLGRRSRRLVAFDAAACTSARRWRTRGWWRTIAAMWLLRALHGLGADPRWLERRYDPLPVPARGRGVD